jgi:ankyrin repeat protein
MSTRSTSGPSGRRSVVRAHVVGGFLIVGALASACGASGPSGTYADAVAASNYDLARSLAASGANPDEPRVNDLTPLMRATIRDDLAMVEILLDAGADLAAGDPEGLTAAHVAAQANASESLVALVRAGADVETRSRNGMSALHHAAALDSVEVLELLAGMSIDLDAQSGVVTQGHGHPRDEGSTALGIAARAGNIRAVASLLELGASVDAPSAAGLTPLLLAVFSNQSPNLVQILLEAGADPSIEAACEAGCSGEGGDALAWANRLERTSLAPLLEDALGA